MEEELLKKYYEEYKEKCFELMFQIIPSNKPTQNMNQKEWPNNLEWSFRGPFYDGYAKIEYFTTINDYILSHYRIKHSAFIDKSGQIKLECNRYKAYGLFNEGCIFVLNDKHQWNFIDIDGNTILPKWQNQHKDDFCFFNFEKGFAQIPGTNSKYISKNGEIVSRNIAQKHYKHIKDLKEDYEIASVKKDGYYYIIYGYVGCNIKKSNIDKSINGYILKDQNIKLKYKPIYDFSKHVICEDKVNYYLYDKISKKYCKLGSKYDITFYNNMIINKNTKEVFYIDSDKNELIDISSIYWNKLIGLGTYELKYNYVNVISYSDFKDKCKNDNNIMALIDYEVRQIKNELQNEENRKREEILKEEALLIHQQQLEKEAESLKNLNEALKNMRKALNSINNLKKDNLKKAFIKPDELLIKVEDHYEIKEEYKMLLKLFDLSAIDFINTKMSNIDFSHCNLYSLNPQLVYNQDMSNCNFTGATFSASINFKGINIENTSFDDNQAQNIPQFISFEGAIYNSNTIFPKWYKPKTIVKK